MCAANKVVGVDICFNNSSLSLPLFRFSELTIERKGEEEKENELSLCY